MASMLAAYSASAAAFAPVASLSRAAPVSQPSLRMETVEDLKGLATELNPAVGFWDPIGLSKAEFYDYTNEETIGFIRHAEIKHGRVAMAAFVGYLVGSNGIRFPWDTKVPEGIMTPPEQWDALPEAAKWQIVLAIGFLEWWSELRLVPGEKHYMKGGKPGYVPPFDATPEQLPHWIGFNLYDPFKFHKDLTSEKKAKLLVTEINNGRLAMIGIFGFLSESKIPGSVPLLKGYIPFYAGEYMKPFADF